MKSFILALRKLNSDRVRSVHPKICGIEISRGLISRPENCFAKHKGVLLDENLSFLHHIQVVELKIFPELWNNKETKGHFAARNTGLAIQRYYQNPFTILCNDLAIDF